MYFIGIIIIILLIVIIVNQQEIDAHICEDKNRDEDCISFKGLINNIVFKINVFFKDIKYYILHNKES